MTKKISKIVAIPFKLLFSRFTLALLSVLLQAAIIGAIFFFFDKYLLYYVGSIALFQVGLTIYIINSSIQSEFKTAWIILVLSLPVVGGFFFLFCKIEPTVKAMQEKLNKSKKENYTYLPQNREIMEELKEENQSFLSHANYLYKVGHFPVYYGEDMEYFSCGEEAYPDLLAKLKEAQKFIFLEFFIIANDEMWQEILDILIAKARMGVEVRVLYDGTCSFTLLPHNYPEFLQEKGIKCLVFSPIVPLISTHYNNRDHRKIIVIDGKYGYTGGMNLASEYINKKERFGYWKDNLFRFSGEAVNSLTVLFLESWHLSQRKKEIAYKPYLTAKKNDKKDGYLVVLGDDPCDNEPISKMTYMHLLYTAKKSIDIVTPYFIVDGEFLNALFYAAKRGVRIRLLLPGIPDKKLINYVAKTYYKELVTHNINLYEYTKGFTHLKEMICDDLSCFLGTSNLDYRSLYLHFEDGLYLYKSREIQKIKEDYERMIASSKKITLEEIKKISKGKIFLGRILRIFGPLL